MINLQQKELLKRLLSLALMDCKISRSGCIMAGGYNGTHTVEENEKQILLIEETYKEVDKL